MDHQTQAHLMLWKKYLDGKKALI